MQITFNLKEKQDCLLAMKMIGDYHGLNYDQADQAETPEPKDTSPPTKHEPTHSIQDLRVLAKEYMGKDKEKREKVKALLEEMEVKGGISKIPEDKIDAFAEKLKALD